MLSLRSGALADAAAGTAGLVHFCGCICWQVPSLSLSVLYISLTCTGPLSLSLLHLFSSLRQHHRPSPPVLIHEQLGDEVLCCEAPSLTTPGLRPAYIITGLLINAEAQDDNYVESIKSIIYQFVPTFLCVFSCALNQ